MIRRFSKNVRAVLAGCAAITAMCAAAPAAEAQEIQVTGPLAGAPPVRKLRLHRDGKLEISIGASFTLLDQYLRTAMPGGSLTYHFTDWIGLRVFGGYGLQYSTGLTQELQTTVNGYNCANTTWTSQCQLTAVNLTRGQGTSQNPGTLANDQFGHLKWFLAPEIVAVPFRGKISLFANFFIDSDVAFFVGPAFIGVQERENCGVGASISCSTWAPTTDPTKSSFNLASRVAVAPTFGLGLNFYPGNSIFGIGFEFRAFPFAWNTSGFDNHGGGPNGNFPDGNVNSSDREFHFNTMATVNLKVALPASIKSTR